jgi:hypothetical protein
MRHHRQIFSPLWVNVVGKYSGMGLTKVSDRLPALSGLAKAFNWRNLGEYRASLWDKDIGHWLLWRSGNSAKSSGGIEKKKIPSSILVLGIGQNWHNVR